MSVAVGGGESTDSGRRRLALTQLNGKRRRGEATRTIKREAKGDETRTRRAECSRSAVGWMSGWLADWCSERWAGDAREGGVGGLVQRRVAPLGGGVGS